MINRMTVEIKEARFLAYHGLYAEEQKTGNEFIVTLKVDYEVGNNEVLTIDETVNYVSLYELLKEQMQHPRDLLETLAMDIINEIQSDFPMLSAAEISIEKLNAPIDSFAGKVGVVYKKQF
jgi:7,8-dihydroneopterin aldolase/epimerase/oxygenase